MIGGISEQRGLVHHHTIAESNNAEHFETFLLGLKKKCEGRRTLIILDNLKIHYAKKLNPLYSKHFKPMFLPPYSSELNPIERLWAVLKQRWRKSLVLHVGELQRARDTRSEDQRTKQTIAKLEATIGKESIYKGFNFIS